MKIRSITYFKTPRWPIQEDDFAGVGDFVTGARAAYQDAGYTVQTMRLATASFPTIIQPWDAGQVTPLARGIEAVARGLGFDYLSLGPALPQVLDSYAAIPDAIAASEIVFFSGVMGTKADGISLPAVRACADVIHRAAPLDPNGFANLYFCALGNVPPGAPFFPAAYHQGEEHSFAIATEAASLALMHLTHTGSLAEAVSGLVRRVEAHAAKLAAVGDELARKYGIPFSGLDFSLAPFPDEANSLGTAMERLGVPGVGRHGSLTAAAILADALDRADFPRAGVNGLFFPQLEDSVLAARAAEGILTVKDLLLYSAVCGTGLDTLALPGDTTREQLAALLLDLAALAQRLEKPLTARLMPIPGKAASDPTNFDFPFFANSRVLALEAEPLTGLLAGDESFKMSKKER